jgi:hypothetical protein
VTGFGPDQAITLDRHAAIMRNLRIRKFLIGDSGMHVRTIGVFFGVIMILGGVRAGAHHSWNTVFSEDKPLVLRGTLAKVELVNPHGWIWIEVKGADGMVTRWGIEGGPPNNLIRNGITKDTLKLGEELVVRGYGARDGSNLLAGVKYERADGKEFWLGNDGAEALAKARGDLK